MHLAEVDEVQLAVEHEATPSHSVADASDAPNCRPKTVTGAAPEVGAFIGQAPERTGAAQASTVAS